MRNQTPTVAGLVLLALLTPFGAGRAHADFCTAVGEGAGRRADWGHVLIDLLEGRDEAAQPPAGATAPPDVPPTQEPPAPPPCRARDAAPAPAPARAGDAGPPGSSSPNAGGLLAAAPGAVELPTPTLSGRLFLAGCSLRPQASSSRLFRPPRA